MKTEVVEQEKVKKKEVAVGAGALILLLLVVFAFAKKKKYECPYCDATFDTKAELDAHIAAEHPDEPIPDGEAQIKVLGIGFEGSPQEPTITKMQGEEFTAYIDIENSGGEAAVPFELGIGSHTIWHDDFGNSPWKATFTCPRGKSKLKWDCKLSDDFPAQPDNPFDAWVIVHGKHYDFHDCFTVIPISPLIQVLSISWL